MSDTYETVREVTVENAWCVGIVAKYCGPGDVRGSRWRVWRGDGTYREDPDAIESPYRPELNSGADNAAAAVADYLARKDNDNWRGRWVVAAGGADTYVAVRIPLAGEAAS